MPQRITYAGRPVKRRRWTRHGLHLRFYGQAPGQPGPSIVVSQAEWEHHGRVEYFDASEVQPAHGRRALNFPQTF